MKMEIIGPIFLSLIAGLSTSLGSIFIFLNIKNRIGEFIVLSLSFSLGIMALISIFDLLPSSSIILINRYGYIYGILFVILIFLIGYTLVGRINVSIKKKGNSLYKIGILSLISLILHNFPEGASVFISAYTNINLGTKMCIAIMLHNIPEGIAISIPLYYSGVKKSKVILYTLLSGVSEPIGAVLSYVVLNRYINNVTLSFILIFVSGLMISLSINDILKEVLKYNKKQYIIYGTLLSVVLFLLLGLL